MAVEAVLKVNEAELRGGEMIKSANEKAREMIQKAELDGLLKRKAIIEEAGKIREGIIQKAVLKAQEECAVLEKQSETKRQQVLNPGTEKLARAAEIAIKKVVNRNDS